GIVNPWGGAFKILNNYFASEGTAGGPVLQLGAFGGQGNSAGAVVANNVFEDEGINDLVPGVLFANNTFAAASIALQINFSGSGGATVVNNIFALNSTAAIQVWTGAVTEHHNLFFGNARNYTDIHLNNLALAASDKTSDPAFVDGNINDIHFNLT